jgi:hypothetical protein
VRRGARVGRPFEPLRVQREEILRLRCGLADAGERPARVGVLVHSTPEGGFNPGSPSETWSRLQG